MTTFSLEILTPYRTFLKGKVGQIIVPMPDGLYAFMAGHYTMVSPTLTGIVAVETENGWKKAAVSAGMIAVTAELTTLLVRSAEWPEEIDVDRAKAALRRADERLASTDFAWERERSDFARQRAQARISLAERDAGFPSLS